VYTVVYLSCNPTRNETVIESPKREEAMRRHQSGWVLVPAVPVLLILVTLLQSGCSSETTPNVYKNEPPTVWIAAGPPQGSVAAGYTIGFEWGGWDPDGRIDHFEYCITDNDGAFDPGDTTGADHWTDITGNEGVFQFTADQPADPDGDDLVAEFRRSHTFFLRSVDDQGAPSRVPAYRSFTATTLSPEVVITFPRNDGLNPSFVPPISTFRWIATDYSDDDLTPRNPEAVSWILEPLINHNQDWNGAVAWVRNLPVDAPEWGDWVPYQPSGANGMSWTTRPLDFGNYILAVRARDEAGAITPVFDKDKNLLWVLVHRYDGGPLLKLYNPYMGRIETAVYNTPLVIMDFPASVPVEFEWTAATDGYGGTIIGYRYGWDIADLRDPPAWEIDWTPFPPRPPGEPARAQSPLKTFNFGTHVFRVEISDNSGYVSALEIKINVFQMPMFRTVLLVDDFVEGEWSGWDNPVGRGILPDDAEHDVFWENTLSDVDGFLPVADVLEVSSGDLIPLSQLADYKAIIWSVLGHLDQPAGRPAIYDLIKFLPVDEWNYRYPRGKVATNPLALYMAAGGHLLICGQHPVSMSINDTYAPDARFPIMFQHELDLRKRGQDTPPDTENSTGDDSYGFRDLCLEAMDFAFTDADRWRPGDFVCPEVSRNNPPGLERDVTMRAALPIDPGFPRLQLRPETADPGRWYDPAVRGLDAELYNPSYFLQSCMYVSAGARECFEPIYGLDCIDTAVPGYNQPAAFWTSVYADVVAETPGAVGARSAVFGFPPVLFDPAGSRAAIEHILFEEWQLPRIQN
jgi:hypothetical protein